MGATSRQFDSSLEQGRAFFSNACRIGFFQAVRLLRRLLTGRNPIGGFYPPWSEVVRFVANPSLAFPASELQDLTFGSDLNSPTTVSVNFMGLSSPQGVLPSPYTELILDRSQANDHGLRDFLDIFNHRWISLFYRAWEKHRFFVAYETGDRDAVTPLMMDLLGLGTSGLEKRQNVPDQALVFYAGLISQKPRSAQNLKQLLSDYFQVPVEIEQFIGRWVSLQSSYLTVLDDSESERQQLGSGAIVGDEVWDQQSTVRVKLGPLTREQYLDFLPRKESQAFNDLRSLLKFWSNDELDFEVVPILKKEDTPAFHLDKHGEQQIHLGWTTWIKNAELNRDPSEATLYM